MKHYKIYDKRTNEVVADIYCTGVAIKGDLAVFYFGNQPTAEVNITKRYYTEAFR